MNEFEPGTVAVATVRGVQGLRVFRMVEPGDCLFWTTVEKVAGTRVHFDDVVTDIRQLVVLDLGPVDGSDLSRAVRDGGGYDDWSFLADQIVAQNPGGA